MRHIDTFEMFEAFAFDRFMQQAQVAQSGNPYWFGRNPKPKKKGPALKKKSTLVKKNES
jgi:hypothetical protein